MRHLVRIGILALLITATGTIVASQSPPSAPSQQGDPPYVSRATAVLVDVVVRDKQGRPVLDLRPEDFEIFEDRVPQEIGSFTLVQRGGGIGIDVRFKQPPEQHTTVVNPGAPAPPEAEPVPSVVALVFDTLSAEALTICQKAALDYVKMTGETDARVGVFATEPYVRVLQRYTREPALIRTAVQHLMASGTEAASARSERLEQLRQRRAELDVSELTVSGSTVSATGNLGQAAAAIGQFEVERRLLQGEMRMLQAFDTLDRDHRGYGTTTALLAVLQSMAFMPGRKSVVFFSEGLPASPALQHQLQSVIESANRDNITVYAVDAGGLRVLSSTSETRKEIQAAAEERLRQSAQTSDDFGGPLSRVLERAEDVIRFDSQSGLARLAEDTGGFLLRDTNDISGAFKRIDEDMRFHYLLTYSPRNDVLDGKFRTIDVKVRRPGTTVYSRKGYRAIRAPGVAPVFSYEAPALVMLDSGALPNAFPSRASAFVFPDPQRPGLTPVVVRVMTDALQFQVDETRRLYSAQAAVVVRVRDASGQIVHKLSQQYVLSGESKDLAAAKAGEILFYRELELQPGAYQVESLVYDAIAEKGSGRVATAIVPGPESPRLRMSSLVLVARAETTPGQGRPAQDDRPLPPFYYGDTLLYPNLGEPLKRGPDEALSFYFVVYPVPGRCACSARISLLRNGSPIAEATRPLEPAGQARLQHVGRLPIGDLPAGTYELRVSVTDTLDQQSRSTFFTVS
jgi:VWFA-related protein